MVDILNFAVKKITTGWSA